ncbi:MAG TPA: hypothetical protein VF529_16525 [Solirubrobacteraceae bacterium]|jgi:hypothetical protein
MDIIIQALAGGIGVAVGGVITYAVNVRDRRQQHIERLFNDAIASVAAAGAARQFINNVPEDIGLPGNTARALETTIREQAYLRFVSLVAEARAALALVVPFREDLQPFLASAAGVAEEADTIVARLREGSRD